MVAWWPLIPATNERNWQAEVAVTPWVSQDGDRITIHGVRNFDYRTETDFTPHWEDRTYDLRELDSVDLIAVYWAGKAIAHIMVSFGFAGRDYVAVSIETRKERGQSYSTMAGFFKQYELVYIVGDERDLIGVRTSYRQAPGGRVRLSAAGAARESPPVLPGLREDDERAARAPAVLQHAHDQLHHERPAAHARQPGGAAVVVEDPASAATSPTTRTSWAGWTRRVPFAELERQSRSTTAPTGPSATPPSRSASGPRLPSRPGRARIEAGHGVSS